MEQFFDMILQNSAIGIVFLAVLLIFRQLTKNFPKVYVHVLWILLMAELVVPPVIRVPFYSVRSFTAVEALENVIFGSSAMPEQTENEPDGNYGGGTEDEDEPLMQEESQPYPAENHTDAGSMGNEAWTGATEKTAGGILDSFLSGLTIKKVWMLLWLSGVLSMALFYLEQFLKLKRRVGMAVKTEEGVWESENIRVPFVMPGIPARIYLPVGLKGKKREDILAHERQHIRHFDPWMKGAAALVLILHWFNPFIWLAYRLMHQDMEMFCDESVLKGKSFEEKKEYSRTLLDFAAGTNGFSLTLSFGESNTKSRIKHILYAKKPKLWLSLFFILLILFCGIFFLTAGRGSVSGTEGEGITEASEMSAAENGSTESGSIGGGSTEADAPAETEAALMETDTPEQENAELTLEAVVEAYQNGTLAKLDYHSYSNSERQDFGDGVLNYYLNFYFFYGNEEFCLGVSCRTEDDTLGDIYLTQLSTSDMAWLYTDNPERHPEPVDINDFLSRKTGIDDWLTIELPEGYWLSDYNAAIGYNGGGALIEPEAYEAYGEGAPAEWRASGVVARILGAKDGFTFEDGRLVAKVDFSWNHASAEKVETLDGLDMPAIIYHGNFDLYTAAELWELEQQGIAIPEEETTSDYWYIYFAREGEDVAYYLGLAANRFTKEEAVEIAKTIQFK